MAVECMRRLNMHGAEFMQEFKAHAATDVTGMELGIVGITGSPYQLLHLDPSLQAGEHPDKAGCQKSVGSTWCPGFGLLGHGNNLAETQKPAVNITIHTLPIIKDMFRVSEKTSVNFGLKLGVHSVEHAGSPPFGERFFASRCNCTTCQFLQQFPKLTFGHTVPAWVKAHHHPWQYR